MKAVLSLETSNHLTQQHTLHRHHSYQHPLCALYLETLRLRVFICNSPFSVRVACVNQLSLIYLVVLTIIFNLHKS